MSYFFAFLILLASTCFAETKQNLLREGNVVALAPPVVNKDYYLLEFGYVIQKKLKRLDYGYNAYVNASLFEDWRDGPDNLHAGALGFKGGVLFPVPFVPLFMKLGGGFAKTVLHKNPIFGKSDQSVDRKDMLLAELGVLYKFEHNDDHFFVSFTFQKNNVRYFGRKTFFAFGVNY